MGAAILSVRSSLGRCLLVFLSVLALTVLASAAPRSSIPAQLAYQVRPLGAIHSGSWSRSLKQADVVPTSNGSFVLAAKRTDRPDPLKNFHHYHGGWDIRNQSYWASVGFTGIPGFILALLWLALGLMGLLLLCCCFCCCIDQAKHEHDHGRCGYFFSLFLLLLFTVAAIGGCSVLFVGQDKFHKELSQTLNYVVNTSDTTVQELHNVTLFLSQASNIDVESYGIPSTDKQKIQQLNVQIDQASAQLQNKTESNASKIRNVINNVRLALIIVSGVMLLLVLLGLLFSACGVRSVVYFLVVVGWILVVGTWILCGIFILLNNAVGDTCVAMQEWVNNPYAHTSLDDILPCVDPQTGHNTLLQSKGITSTLVNNVNLAISIVINNNNNKLPAPLFYNQSGPALAPLCNPYGSAPNYSDQACADGTLDLATAAGNWSNYICTSNANGECTSRGRLTQKVYNQLAAATNVCFGLQRYGPFLVDLEDCQTVRNTFTAIERQHCHKLRKYTKWVWVGLAIVSAGSMLSILLWMIYIRRRNYRYGGSGKKV